MAAYARTATSSRPAASSASRTCADLAVHHPAQADHVGAGRRLGQGHLGVPDQRRVVVDGAAGGEHAAVAVVGELVEAQVGLHDERVAHLGDGVGDGEVEDAVRVGRLRADGVPHRAGSRRASRRPDPAPAASATALRSESRVCWTTPGIDAIGCGSVSPSLTNTGRTSCEACSRVSAVRRRIAGVARRRRGRMRRSVTGAPRGWGSVRASPCSRPWPARRPGPVIVCSVATPASGRPRRAASAAVVGPMPTSSVLVGGGPSWVLSSRTVLADVSRAPRIVPSTHASRTSADGGVGRDGAVRDHVVDLPAAGAQAVGERRGGEVAAGEQDARSVGPAPGTPPTSALGGGLAARHEVDVHARRRAGRGRCPGPTAATRASVRCRPRSTQDRHGGGAGHHQPLVPAGLEREEGVGERRRVLGRDGLDERDDDGLGPRGRERDDGRAAPRGGPGDQHAPAGEGEGGHRRSARSAAPCARSSSASAVPRRRASSSVLACVDGSPTKRRRTVRAGDDRVEPQGRAGEHRRRADRCGAAGLEPLRGGRARR